MLDDWHEVTVKEVRVHGGAGLLKRYGDSLVQALCAVYPLLVV